MWSGRTWVRAKLSAVALSSMLATITVCAAPATAQVAAPAKAGTATASSSAVNSYIVRADPGRLPDVAVRVAALDGRVTNNLGLINAVVADLPAAAVADLRADDRVADVTPDSRLHLMSGSCGLLGCLLGGAVGLLDSVVSSVADLLSPEEAWDPATASNPATDRNSLYSIERSIGARGQWTLGYTGAGIDVALLDSGIAPVAGLSAPGKVINGPDLTWESQDTSTRYLDTFGHGTHMAGIIAGRDTGVDPIASVNNATPFLGVAPGARIVSVKVADVHGATDVSQVIAGIDWVVQHARDPGLNIRVLNLSFGTDSTQSYLYDPLAYAAEIAWRKGIVVVIAAGNNGTVSGRLTNPAIDPFSLAVGSADTSAATPVVPTWSSRGDGVRNPDVIAPSVHVPSLRVPGSYVDTAYGGTPAAGERFIRGSGTSQAAAVTSGAAALLLQRKPSLTPDQVKYSLRSSAVPLVSTPTAQGRGMLSFTGISIHLATPPTPQPFTRSVGGGSLEGARGTSHLTLGGVALTGEKDIFGKPFYSASMATLEAAGTAWTGGMWNGSLWTGTGWVSGGWSTPVWTGRTWAGDTWTGRTWADGYWNGRTWADTNWSGG